MKKLAFLVLLSLVFSASFAQPISKPNLKIMQQKEDSLRKLSGQIIQGINADNRFTADSTFTRTLVRALKTPHSFYYPFDSLQTVSVLYSPDSVFRVFTWQLVINENVIRQHGAIQMKTYDGSLKLYPLIDKSDVTTKVADTIGNHLGWIGAIYYKIILKKSGNTNFYTLLGFDENNIRSSRKIIEVMHFMNEEPTFGGRYFSFEEDSVFKSAQSRFILEYKKEAGPRLNYDKELDMIIVEHLVSESNEPHKKWTLVGDGDYEGFKWRSGKWVHVEKVFSTVTPDGEAPVPSPIRDPSGNIDENKLKAIEQEPRAPVKPKGKGDRE
jgi:outer membrane lipoprotein-sorting protein